MSRFRTSLLIPALAAIVLASGALWSFNYMEDNRSGAATAAREAASCERLAAEIQRLRDQHQSQPAGPSAGPDLTSRITRAAASAGLAAGSLDRIDPDPDRHAASGNFIERPTRVLVRQATLRQLITFLHALDDPGQGLRIERIHLTTPAEGASDGAWTAESTIVHAVRD